MFFDNLRKMTGIDIPIEELGLTIHQPKIKEISILGEDNYLVALAIMKKATTLDLYKKVLQTKFQNVQNTKSLILNFLTLYFKDLVFEDTGDILIKGQDKSIGEKEYEIIHRSLLMICSELATQEPKEEFNPGNERARQIAEKMNKARKRLEQQNVPEKTSDKIEGFLDRYILAAVIIGQPLSEILEMTFPILTEVVQFYIGNWEDFDLEIKSRLAGAKNEDKLEHWLFKKRKDKTTPVPTFNK